MKNYELIEHTADIGIKVKAKDLKELFKNVALAMFDIITGEILNTQYSILNTQEIIIKQKAENLEELFINWLNELLSLSDVKEIIFSDFKINKLNENNLEAVALGEDIKNYKINTEIKAATYHELEIKRDNSGWKAQVIFDV